MGARIMALSIGIYVAAKNQILQWPEAKKLTSHLLFVDDDPKHMGTSIITVLNFPRTRTAILNRIEKHSIMGVKSIGPQRQKLGPPRRKFLLMCLEQVIEDIANGLV